MEVTAIDIHNIAPSEHQRRGYTQSVLDLVEQARTTYLLWDGDEDSLENPLHALRWALLFGMQRARVLEDHTHEGGSEGLCRLCGIET